MDNYFKNNLAKEVFYHKYALSPEQTWADKARSIVDDVCGEGYYGQWGHPLMSKEDRDYLTKCITEMKFLPGGRYIYYAGRKARFWNNCYLLRGEEDTREEWADLSRRAMSCLTTGGGIGIDYSIFRPAGKILSRTGGQASGPIPLMKSINEIGRNVMQGGSRRSAIYASLNWQHDDIEEFLKIKNWFDMPVGESGYSLWHAKQEDFNFPAPLDMTNISLNYNNEFKRQIENGFIPSIFIENCRQALSTSEPGFSFNFGTKENETLRNATGKQAL